MAATIDTPPLLTARDVAALLRFGVDTVSRLRATRRAADGALTDTGPLRFRPRTSTHS